MTTRLFKRLLDPIQAISVLGRLYTEVRPLLEAGKVLEVRVSEETRRSAQNALLHAELTEIANSCKWAGQSWDVEVWKRLLVAAWLRATGEQVIVLPALDGAGVDVVFRRTSELTVAECSELVEFVKAWRAMN